MSAEQAIADEIEIVWEEDVSRMRYVREILDGYCPFRRRISRRWDRLGRRVGYAVLSPSARSRNGFFTRRIFWLAPHDPYEGGGCPCEAVDPTTVVPGRRGECNDRAAGRPVESPAKTMSAEK